MADLTMVKESIFLCEMVSSCQEVLGGGNHQLSVPGGDQVACVPNEDESLSSRLLSLLPVCKFQELLTSPLIYLHKVSPSVLVWTIEDQLLHELEVAAVHLDDCVNYKTSYYNNYYEYLFRIGKNLSNINGNPTCSILRFGFGEMTVLLEKSTIFPHRFPLNLPCFPFNLCTNPLMYFFGALSAGTPDSWDLKVESTLELQDVPVILDHLEFGSTLPVLHDHIIQEHYFCHLFSFYKSCLDL